MADTLENLHRRKESAAELDSVVRTMKAMAASGIGQYEAAVKSLQDYYRTVTLSIYASFINQHMNASPASIANQKENETIAIVFGSDQGLVGRFNDVLADFVQHQLQQIQGNKKIWIVGERMLPSFNEKNFIASKTFTVPNSVDGITSLVNEVLIKIEEAREQHHLQSLYLFHNAPLHEAGYEQTASQILPLDGQWKKDIGITAWPTKLLPGVIGGNEKLLPALIREFLFMSLYKACAESLASENASRLEAMQRAEKNIGEMLDDLNQTYNRLRQSTIDEELFDVVAGFEALKNKNE
ncbi:MAG TPA: F0F1 ATP synthase subunit gamma [Chitinophagaceae bacterium]|nr:F0F1 ATP synthase subunit gamma [Chitinophagaceae bacterium]